MAFDSPMDELPPAGEHLLSEHGADSALEEAMLTSATVEQDMTMEQQQQDKSQVCDGSVMRTSQQVLAEGTFPDILKVGSRETFAHGCKLRCCRINWTLHSLSI